MSGEWKRSTVEMVGHPRTKGRATGENKPRPKPPRHSSTLLGTVMEDLPLLFLWKVRSYGKYAAPGRPQVSERSPLSIHRALKRPSITTLPSFRATTEGEQHADDVSQDTGGAGALPLQPGRSPSRWVRALARNPGVS